MTDASAGDSERYSTLREDLETAERILAASFRRADEQALEYQNKFRKSELTIIWGGVVAVALGIGAGISSEAGGDVPLTQALGFAEVVITFGLGSLAFIAKGLKWQPKWHKRRWAAETLRGERYFFLGRFGPYVNADEPDRMLRQRIVEIERMVREGVGGE